MSQSSPCSPPERPDWVATDLDGTLFSGGAAPGAVVATWRDSEHGRVPSSWVQREQLALFTRLQRVFRLVPVTARDLTAFHRISVEGLPFTDGAVIANGAVLLVPGTMEPDEDWSQEMARLLAPWQHPLKRAQEFLDGAAIPTRLITGSRVNGESVPSLVGIAMRRDVLLQGRLRSEEALMSCFDGEGLRVADLGPELHLLPPFVGKQIGLRAFVERHAGGCGPLLALGDTPEDLGFMQNSTFMGLPTRSPLAERLNGRSAYAEEKTERTVDRKRAE